MQKTDIWHNDLEMSDLIPVSLKHILTLGRADGCVVKVSARGSSPQTFWLIALDKLLTLWCPCSPSSKIGTS